MLACVGRFFPHPERSEGALSSRIFIRSSKRIHNPEEALGG
jgi:hypothetical protein